MDKIKTINLSSVSKLVGYHCGDGVIAVSSADITTEPFRRQSRAQRRACGRFITHTVSVTVNLALADGMEPMPICCGTGKEGKLLAAKVLALID